MDPQPSSSGNAEAPPLSKNQLKKLKRDQEWEANCAKRKAKRKEKIQEKKLRKRAARKEAAQGSSTTSKPATDTREGKDTRNEAKTRRPQFLQLPITLILDCGFDDLMHDKERKSLGSQVTRCYSDNHRAPFQAHLAVSSFGGNLKERFEGILEGHYHSWRNVRFLEEDFVKAAEQAKEWMGGEKGGRLAGVFADNGISEQSSEELSQAGEVVYLTSDSPYTLTELRPYSTYIIGGLVDRNRHKGICYKRAMDQGMKTAKLPIGDYMQMTSHFVLATNHVVEIMLRWLDLGDWGKAFLQVVPKRKGGVLKDTIVEANGEPNDETPGDDREAGENTKEEGQILDSDTKEEDEEVDASSEEGLEDGRLSV